MLRRLRRPGITAKLFFAILGVTLLVVVTMVVMARYTFQEGFADYVRERQQQRAEAVAEVLAGYYAQHGDWDGLRDRRHWRALLHEAIGELRHDGRRPPDDRDEDHDRRPPPEARLVPILLNADGDRVAGPPLPGGPLDRVPVQAGGTTVGWVAYRPLEHLTDRLAVRFEHEVSEAAWLTALVVGLLAAVVSLLLARGFLAPVSRLARATRALAAGHFETRVDEPRRDELGQLSRDFNRLADTLERNERLRREFMADMSHELRTPLSVLRAELEAIEDGVRPFTRENLAGLQRTLATLSQLVDDLYDLSLADAGALAYRMADLDFAALVAETVESWRGRFASAGLMLSVALPQRPLEIAGDGQRLGQLLANLLRNSLQYTDAGGEVRLSLAAEGENAVLRLEDSAPGVPADDLPRLFERLYRVVGSRSRASGGAGLGLAICERIAHAHNGSLEAYPSRLGGLGIRLRLPREARP